MGQNSIGCCEKDNRIDPQLLITMKKMNQPKQSGERPEKANYGSRLLGDATMSDIFKCQKVAVPVKNIAVTHTLQNLSPLKPIQTYEKGQYKPDYYKFDNTGIIYNGEWKGNAPHGFGANYYPNQSYYEGVFVQGIPHGIGRFVNTTGDYYQGQVRFGRANGFGYYENSNFNYRGFFKDNLKHGKGVERTNDSFFEGYYDYDQKRQGLLKYNDSTYEGAFHENTFNGRGKLTNSKGVYIGEFKNGQQNGYGEYSWKDGSIYRGYFRNGERQGDGEYYNSKNKSIARGYWKKGLLNGNGEYFEPTGEKHRCIWQNSKIKSIIQ